MPTNIKPQIVQYEHVVIDPLLGEVSCDNRSDAIDYADKVNGRVFCAIWKDGKESARYLVYPLDDLR